MAGELRPRDAGLRAKAMEFPKAALPLSILGVSENSGCFWGSHSTDYNMFGSRLGFLYLRKLPYNPAI